MTNLKSKTETAYIGLGSNLGDRVLVLTEALKSIGALPGTAVVQVSSLYETEAVGGVAEQDFVNGVAQIQTDLGPHDLIRELLNIEKHLGRVRFKKWGDRTCDLDLLVYNDIVLDDPECRIPHPEIPNRRFVLEPLCEIEPNLRLPRFLKTAEKLLKECQDEHWIHRIES
jgi:2-amino-4-hydroxy-6-hydroxymethyldihydropteridine diphosphokinase